jgi:hypothetical protein
MPRRIASLDARAQARSPLDRSRAGAGAGRMRWRLSLDHSLVVRIALVLLEFLVLDPDELPADASAWPG